MQATAHVTFDDEFNSLSLWNGSSGTWATTFWYQDLNSNGATLAGNGEQEWYINSNYGATSSVKPWTAANGVATLTAAPASSAISSQINGYGYTSGELNSYHSFSQTYGYFEMRAQLPSGQGFWPAFWLMPTDGAWPPELDVMEVLGNNTSVLYNTVHSLQTGSHTAVGDGGVTVANMSSGYHTYGVDWEPDYITFFFDGQAVYKTATPADMNGPMYMIANLAAGGYWPGNVTPGSVGQMNIDYIRAYASGAAAGSTSTSTPTPPATTTGSSTSTSNTSTSNTSTSNTSSTGGQTFTSDNNGDHWTGTAGNDTFNLGRGGDVVTGNGGTDTFKFAEVPWAAGHITDFAGQDVLDLAFLKAYGYSGSDPIADGHVKLVSNGQGGTQVWADLDGLPVGSGTWLVTTLDGIAPANVSWQNGHLVDPPSGSSSGSSTSTSTSTSTSASTPSTTGQTFTSDNNGDHWTGTAGNDTFNLGRGGDVVSGAGGNDIFKFAETPWAAGHITDFSAGDSLDLSGLLAHSGYSSGDAVAEGYLKVTADAAGEAQIWSHLGGQWWLVDTLDHVAPSSLSISNGVITEGGASTSTGGGSSSTTGSTAASTGTTGQTFSSDNNGDHWTGTAGNDTFNLGRGGDVVSGAGGNDVFKFAETPWAAGHITDFSAGDALDLTGLLARSGYASGDAVAEGYLKVTADAAGEAQVWSHLSGQWWLVDTLDHFAPSSLHISGAFITG